MPSLSLGQLLAERARRNKARAYAAVIVDAANELASSTNPVKPIPLPYVIPEFEEATTESTVIGINEQGTEQLQNASVENVHVEELPYFLVANNDQQQTEQIPIEQSSQDTAELDSQTVTDIVTAAEPTHLAE